MSPSASRRRLAFGLALVTSLLGGVLASGSSSATASAAGADSLAGANAQVAAKAAARAKPRLPQGCRTSDGMIFTDRTNIRGKRGKLIGHVSMYMNMTFGDRPNRRVCVITWRNGVARGNKNKTYAIMWGNKSGDSSIWRETGFAKRNPIRSRPALRTVPDAFWWWGKLRYKGVWYSSIAKYES